MAYGEPLDLYNRNLPPEEVELNNTTNTTNIANMTPKISKMKK